MSNLANSQARLQRLPAHSTIQADPLLFKKLGRDKLVNLGQNSSAWRHALDAEEILELNFTFKYCLPLSETKPILKAFSNCVQRSQGIYLISTG